MGDFQGQQVHLPEGNLILSPLNDLIFLMKITRSSERSSPIFPSSTPSATLWKAPWQQLPLHPAVRRGDRRNMWTPDWLLGFFDHWRKGFNDIELSIAGLMGFFLGSYQT